MPLSALRRFHMRAQPNGVAPSYSHVYGWMSCTEVADRAFGECDPHGPPCPYEIPVCVEGAERDEVWDAIRASIPS